MTIRIPAIERKAEENIRKWVFSKHAQERLEKHDLENHLGPYLLISREAGAGGSDIARRIGARLEWDVLDKEIVDYLADEYGTPRSLVEFLDEKRSHWLGEVINSWIEGFKISSSAYTYRLHQLFLLAASHGNVIIVGRGARFILPRDRGLSVRIVAPLELRIENVMRGRGLGAKEARKWVVDADRQREAYIREHFHRDAADPHLYDLVVNREEFSEEEAAEVVFDAITSWMKKTGVRVE